MKLYSSAIALGIGILMVTLTACNSGGGGSSTPATNCTMANGVGGTLVNGICQPAGTSATGTIACTMPGTGQAGVQTVYGCGVLVSSGIGSCMAMVPGYGMAQCLTNGYSNGWNNNWNSWGYQYPMYQTPYYYQQPPYYYRMYRGRRH